MRSGRAEVAVDTMLVIGAHVGAIWLVYTYILGRWIEAASLRVAMAIPVVQFTAILLLLVASLMTKIVRARNLARAGRVDPEIREALAMHGAGEDRSEALAKLRRAHAERTGLCLIEALASVRGQGHERLARLAVELGYVRRWERQLRSRNRPRRRAAVTALGELIRVAGSKAIVKALSHPDEDVQLEAARVLVRDRRSEDLAQVFAFALEKPLLARVVLGGELAIHAFTLIGEAIPAALHSPETRRVLAALELLRSWDRFLPVPAVAGLCKHAEPEVRAAAVRQLRFALLPDEASPLALAALLDPDPRVRVAGAFTAGKLHAVEALPGLASRLEDEAAEVRIAAAFALGELGPRGWQTLENAAYSGSPGSAAALEALARARIGLLSTTGA